MRKPQVFPEQTFVVKPGYKFRITFGCSVLRKLDENGRVVFMIPVGPTDGGGLIRVRGGADALFVLASGP